MIYLSEKIIAYCDGCTKSITTAHDFQELEYNIALNGKCECGHTFGFTKDKKPYNFYISEVSSLI